MLILIRFVRCCHAPLPPCDETLINWKARVFLSRAYGGAILNETNTQQIVLSEADDPYIKDKQHVAEIAVSLISDGDIIFLGPGVHLPSDRP